MESNAEKDERRNHKHFKGGAWNHFRILATGNRVATWINGHENPTTIITADRHKTHPTGYIGLQIHGIKPGTGPFEVAWRNIRIREFLMDKK